MHLEHEVDAGGAPNEHAAGHRDITRRSFLIAGTATAAVAVLPPSASAQAFRGAGESPAKFRRIPTQYIAALADPQANFGSNAQLWGLWRQDPGPRGVRLDRYEQLKAAGGLAPARWEFDDSDWWLEEHGLIMEQPEFPLPPGKYMVTGDRKITTVLSVHPTDANGQQRWELDDDATLYDVTHLRCRSARYTPATSEHSCSPAEAQMSAFPVAPGAEMPPVERCNKQDYAVLIVIAVAIEDG